MSKYQTLNVRPDITRDGQALKAGKKEPFYKNVKRGVHKEILYLTPISTGC
jgi:hypothetical protein